MKYLVDANVLGEPTKPEPIDAVVDWLRKHESELVVSSIVLGELQYGIFLLPAGSKRTRLMKWFEQGVKRFPSLDFDSGVAEQWARLLASLKKKGNAMPIKDSMIAATAKAHGLIVATQNTSDFKPASVKTLNPFPS